MTILGINGGFRQGYQDVSACLVVNGKVIAAIEEERLNRIKFSAGRLPWLSALEVLTMGAVSIQEVDLIAFHGSTWGAEIQPRLEDYFLQHFGFCPPLVRYHHHDCHASAAFYASGFEDALVVTADNSGDGISLQIMSGKQKQLSLIERFARPNSFGLFYQIVTQYCGFVKDSDEYKLMGLASYGDRDFFDFSWLMEVKDGKPHINQHYIVVPEAGAPSLHKDEMAYNQNFIDKMGRGRRIPGTAMNDFYKHMAASAQKYLEDMMLQTVAHYMQLTGHNKLCLAGGVALNCVMNQKLMNASFVKELFVLPSAGDAGISLGAAWLGCVENEIFPVKPEHTYLGNEYTQDEIESMLKISNLDYQSIDDPAQKAAEFIASNKVIGWFQGRMEFGPRALGNRSILANATNAGMQDLVNQKIKFRESFRPFCPSVLEEDANLYFEGNQSVSPYMTVTHDVKREMIDSIPAVTHTDGTARIQTVNETQNPLFYRLLQQLKKLTGHGVVLNTSFNLSHEPIVCSPRDAIASFYASGIDVLFLGNFMIVKSNVR